MWAQIQVKKTVYLFADYFSNVYYTNKVHINEYTSTEYLLNISNFSISSSDIYTKLSGLDIIKGTQPDGIHQFCWSIPVLYFQDHCVSFLTYHCKL